jgi:hypothetical protein
MLTPDVRGIPKEKLVIFFGRRVEIGVHRSTYG